MGRSDKEFILDMLVRPKPSHWGLISTMIGENPSNKNSNSTGREFLELFFFWVGFLPLSIDYPFDLFLGHASLLHFNLWNKRFFWGAKFYFSYLLSLLLIRHLGDSHKKLASYQWKMNSCVWRFLFYNLWATWQLLVSMEVVSLVVFPWYS